MGLSVPIATCNTIYCALPYALVSLAIPTEELGGNMGLLNNKLRTLVLEVEAVPFGINLLEC